MTSDKDQRVNHDGDNGGGDLSLVGDAVVYTSTQAGSPLPSALVDATGDPPEAEPNVSDGSSAKGRRRGLLHPARSKERYAHAGEWRRSTAVG